MTREADAMNSIVARIHPELRAAGFRKRRHTFNRSEEEGITQVVALQMGRKPPPGAQPIPGLRPDLHGHFTMNLGVAVREELVRHLGEDAAEPAFFNEYDCQIRTRLGPSLGAAHDVWLPLTGDDATTTEAIRESLHGPGLDWLEGRSTRAKILEKWDAEGLDALPLPTPWTIVSILIHEGRRAQGEALLRAYYEALPPERHRHRRHVYESALELGITGLAPPDPRS